MGLGLGLRMGMGLSSYGSCLHLALVPQFVVVRAALCEDAGVYLLVGPLLSHSLVPGILTLELGAEGRLLVRPAMINHI
jgi:multisubunit Na+/H+ antiporter MnhE subunit